MESDYAVELGPDDETLDFPWSAPDDHGPRYYDLKRNPDLLSRIEEAQREPQLGEFLKAVNSPATPLETAKCDTWSTTDLNPEEDIFRATHKFGSYIDLLFSSGQRFSFEQNENLARHLAQLLKRVPEIPASAEFLIRRCYFADAEGYYITFYLFGYGEDEQKAHQQWTIGLKLVEHAVRQATAC
ncbi:MAG TPA: hypothetical protein VJQ82_18400 [Terriglobales bacterium]|nr:hypothetical protein [Terriglobales bacterium]